jgi:hypothetical protein
MSPSSSLAAEESHDAPLFKRLDMEVDTRLFPIGKFPLAAIGYLYKTGVAEGKMPHPVIVAIVIVKQLPPLLPG